MTGPLAGAVTIDPATFSAVVIGLGAVIGGGGVLGAVRYLRRSGAHDSRIDKAADAVLGREDDPRDAGLVGQVAAIRRELRPGADPSGLGEVVKRIEKQTNETAAALNRLIGRIDERDKALDGRLEKIERDCPLLNPRSAT